MYHCRPYHAVTTVRLTVVCAAVLRGIEASTKVRMLLLVAGEHLAEKPIARLLFAASSQLLRPLRLTNRRRLRIVSESVEVAGSQERKKLSSERHSDKRQYGRRERGESGCMNSGKTAALARPYACHKSPSMYH